MILSALVVVLLVLVHVFSGSIINLNPLPRKKWLSLAGGISVAFVFLHILPELNYMQESLSGEKLLPPFFENDLYVLAMCGILIFYGLERGIIYFQEKRSTENKSVADKTIFWNHIGVFALFNGIIGYYLHNEMQVDDLSSFLTLLALGFHLLIIDYSLLQHHNKIYDKIGRWIMTCGVIFGWGIGIVFTISDSVSYTLFALLAGAIVVNSFKEELPKEKESNYTFFLIGVIFYTALWIL